MNSQREGIHRARYREGVRSFCARSHQASHPVLPRVHQLEVPQTQSCWGLVEASLDRPD